MLIVFAKLLEGVLKRIGLSSIIAYAAARILLGPVGGLVKTGSEVEAASLSSLGVVAKVLIDDGRLRAPVGVQIFTAVSPASCL